MPSKQHEKPQPRYHVFHPMNTAGTTWLRESDLVFIKKRPYAVIETDREVLIELNPKMLKHDRQAGDVYRYEGELQDPTTLQDLNKLS
jgi:hypothetical protein